MHINDISNGLQSLPYPASAPSYILIFIDLFHKLGRVLSTRYEGTPTAYILIGN